MNKSKNIIITLSIILIMVIFIVVLNSINASGVTQTEQPSNSIQNEANVEGLADKESLVKIGDLTGDGVIEMRDASIVLSYYAQSAAGYDVSKYDYAKDYLDTSGDGRVRVDDATFILSYYAKSASGLIDNKELDIREFVKNEMQESLANS